MSDGYRTTLEVRQQGQVIWPPQSGAFKSTGPKTFVFLWIRRGNAVCQIDGLRYLGREGDVLLVRPKQRWKCVSPPGKPAQVQVIMFAVSHLPEGLPTPETWPVLRRMCSDDIIRPLVAYIASNLAMQGTGISPAIVLAMETLMLAFVCGPVERRWTNEINLPASIRRVAVWVVDSVQGNHVSKVTLADLATISGVSPKQLCHVFKQHLGYSPLELVYLTRVTRSLILLRAGRKIEEIAYQLGFANASHYARRFEALFGMSPGAMRKALLTGYRPELPKLPGIGRRFV